MPDHNPFDSMDSRQEINKLPEEEDIPQDQVNYIDLTPVQQFYYRKCVFITGATGTIGKVLLEKLLRCCPGIGTIYILMRPKNEISADERLDKLLDTELFYRAKEKLPNMREKIRIILGDIELPGLGITNEDIEELKDNVNIAFHSAGSVRWDSSLRSAAKVNVYAVKETGKLLKQFVKLEVFVHVSTFSVHRDPDFTVPEHITKTRITPNQLLTILELLDDETLKMISPNLVKEKYNAYIFSKGIGENVILEEYGQKPTAIVRPPIVTPIYKDPIPGYCDTTQGIQALLIAIWKGFLRAIPAYPGLKVNVIPVDTAVNTLVTTAYHVGTNKPDGIFVVNSCLDYDKLPLLTEELIKHILKNATECPLANMYRYPDVTLYHSELRHRIHSFFDQDIPALVIDTFLFIFTGKPIMRKMYQKLNFWLSEGAKIGKDPHIGLKTNHYKIMNNLCKKDNELFYMKMDDMNWMKYIDDSVHVARKVIMKEDPSNIHYARKKAKVWWFVTTFLKWCIILYFLNYLLTGLFPNSIFS